MFNETIAAISTPLGPGGIGIIRISGAGACAILTRLFFREQRGVKTNYNPPTKENLSSHRVYYGHVIEPGTGNIIDEVLAIYMKAPKSYTREDVVEIQSHSGFVVLDRILSAVVDAGAALAGPGEFAKRAFLNGRIELSQAEAIIDLINAPCETAVYMASRQLAGHLRDGINTLVARITALLATCEASIEFPEALDRPSGLSELKRTINDSILPDIAALIQREKDTAPFREGVLLAIAGAPNVGKSSLLNKLVERETAIVSDVPGTTRDIVREYFSIKGVPVVVCDTAGIHDTEDPVECVGIEKARDHFQRAEIILLVLEATRPLNAFEEKLIEEFNNTKTIAIINKDDIVDHGAILDIENKLRGLAHIRVSAKVGNGIAELKDMIFNSLVSGKTHQNSDIATPNLRQRKILEAARQAIQQVSLAAETNQPLEPVCGMLHNVLHVLEEISGNRNDENLYDHIFSQFCIGK